MTDEEPATSPAGTSDTAATTDAAAVGPDLARAALAAARAEARAKGVDTRRTRRTEVRRASTARSGSGPDDRDPQLLGSVVDRMVAERGWEEPVAVGGAIARWAEIVGAETASHVVPESFDDGELVVVCDSSAWATQMRLLGPTLVRRLNEELAEGTVTRVRVLGPSAPSWRKGRLRVEGRGPRDTYG